MPILAYMTGSYYITGHFWLDSASLSVSTYGRMATAADCATLRIPAYERPLCPNARQRGYGVDWLRALDAVDALGADIVVPGHGPIPADPRETRAGLRRFRQMLVDVRDAVQGQVASGATEDQAVAAVRFPQYEKLQGYDTQREIAVRRLYQQLTGKLP